MMHQKIFYRNLETSDLRFAHAKLKKLVFKILTLQNTGDMGTISDDF